MRIIPVLIFSCLLIGQFSANAQNTENIVQPAKSTNLSSYQDTVRAIKHLFQRKRKSVRVKSAIIGVIADAVLIRSWTRSYEQQHKNLPPGIVTVGSLASEIPTTNYIFLGVSTILTVEILAQRWYGPRRLQTLLNDYEAGKPIPSRIKSKLALKDFD